MGRSLKKGPFCDEHLLKKIDELNKDLVTSFDYIPRYGWSHNSCT